MKRCLNLWGLVFMFNILLCSCSDNEDDNVLIVVPDAKELNQELAADQLESTVHLVAKADWTASIDASTRAEESWISLSPNHGSAGTYDIAIKLEPNQTGKERKAVITIMCGEYRIIIIIIQISENEPITPPDGAKYLLKKIVEMENETEVDEEYFFSYDEQNRPVEIICQWLDGDKPGTGKLLKDSWTFTYQDGKVIETFKDINDKDGSSDITKYCYTLDDKGRILSWEREDAYNDIKKHSNGSFIYGNNGEILRENYTDDENNKSRSYAEWKDGNKVKLGFEDATDMENNRTNYDILTYNSYPNNAAINVDLNIFLHDSEAGTTFASDSYLKLFGNYLGIRSQNYLESYEEHYSFNNESTDLKKLDYEFDAQTGLPIKIIVTKYWNVNGDVSSDTDYFLLEYESVK